MESEVMTTEEHIENVIEKTFKVIQEVYENQQEKDGPKGSSDSRILFPKKSKDETRISEQELRFIFVEQLNKEIGDGKNWDVYYSVETPTRDIYRFPEKEKPMCGKELEEKEIKGQSANFDLVIHDKEFKRIALIEFKANNASEHEHLKDLKKLTNPKEKEYDNNIPTYFIEILKGADRGTFKSLHDKMERKEQVNFRCWALERKGDHDITSNIIESK